LDMESLGHHTLKILAHAYYYYRIFWKIKFTKISACNRRI
jgi:hypothetical protein